MAKTARRMAMVVAAGAILLAPKVSVAGLSRALEHHRPHPRRSQVVEMRFFRGLSASVARFYAHTPAVPRPFGSPIPNP